MDQRPSVDGTPVASLPIGMFGIDCKTGFDHETQRGPVLEADIQAVELARREKLDEVHDLALYLVETIEAPAFAPVLEGLASTCERMKNMRDFLGYLNRSWVRLGLPGDRWLVLR